MTDVLQEAEHAAEANLAQGTPEPGTRQLPWAPLSAGVTESGELLTSQQLLIKAELDWEVGIRPYMRQTAAGLVQSAKMFETYRLDTDDDVGISELGAVKTRYELLQNREAFDFGDSLIQSGAARWTHAGSQQGGSKVFMTMLLHEEFQVLGQVPFKVYLFVSTSHDGSRSLKVYVTPINVWCTNQAHAVRASNVDSFVIQHTSSMHQKLTDATAALQRGTEYMDMIKAQAETLAAVSISVDKARYLLSAVIPAQRPKRDTMISGIMHGFEHSPTINGFRGTGWGLLNALTEYMDHTKTQRNMNARFESIMLGEGAKYRVHMARELAELN